MKIIIVFVLIFFYFSIVESSHFLGGTITWAPINKTDVSPTIPITIRQSYQWLESRTHCDQSYIINQSPLIPPSNYDQLYCNTGSCDNYQPLNVAGYCTDFSTVIDSSSSYNSGIQNLTLNTSFCVAYEGGVWPGVILNCEGPCYEDSAAVVIVCCIDLTPRPEGWINTPPVPTVISPIRVPINTITTLQIPVTDADNDVTRCRWAVNGEDLDECGGICGPTVGCTLESENCTLTCDSSIGMVGDLFPIALMVEDFYDQKTDTPFSSVPIQFVIQIIGAPTCSSKPVITSSLSNITSVEVGTPFQFPLTIKSNCSGVSTVDFYRQSPLYMEKSNITFDRTTNTSQVIETWTPTSDQLGVNVYCAVATDSQSVQSDLYCRTFYVSYGDGSTKTTTTTTTTTTTITTTTTTTTTSTTSTTTTTTSSTSSAISTTTTTGNNSILQTIIVTVQVPVTVLISTTDKSQLVAIGLGIGIPLLLGLIGATLFGIFRNKLPFFGSRRIRDDLEKPAENIPNDQNNGKSLADDAPDYREEYIKTGNVEKANNQTRYLDSELPLPDDSLVGYLSLSKFELQSLNETVATTTTFFSASTNSLPIIDIQNAAQSSLNINKPTQNVSILQQAYTTQKEIKSVNT